MYKRQILFSAKVEDKTLDALEGISGVDLRIRMNGVSIDTDVKSWETVMEEGRNALLEGCRQFMDVEIDPDVMCALLFTCLLYTSNTIYGTHYPYIPDTGDIPLVADMSSCILSEEIDVTKFGLIYAGVQKNVAPSGIAVAIMRDCLLYTSV